jgi:diguanylate cyclase (GGDEF)-like protein
MPTANAAPAGRTRESVERALGILRSMPRSLLYPLLGVALTPGVTAGLLVARAMATGRAPTFAWVLGDVAYLQVTYTYVTLSTLTLLTALGYLLGRWFDGVRLLSITDPLTGLFNRRYFRQRLAQETRRCMRHRHPLCVLSIDIDGLKAINDTLGHNAGDQAIMAVGQVLSQNVRAIDAIARLGGDEFAVLLPETSSTQATALSCRIMTEVSRSSSALTGTLAVSIGLAELSAAEGVKSDDMLLAADVALYRAKASGGGHVVIATPEPVRSVHRPFALTEAVLLLENSGRMVRCT